jgi:hypothetical protein
LAKAPGQILLATRLSPQVTNPRGCDPRPAETRSPAHDRR